eukprot:6203125-Pleurochrysis_carterae.AAC.1
MPKSQVDLKCEGITADAFETAAAPGDEPTMDAMVESARWRRQLRQAAQQQLESPPQATATLLKRRSTPSSASLPSRSPSLKQQLSPVSAPRVQPRSISATGGYSWNQSGSGDSDTLSRSGRRIELVCCRSRAFSLLCLQTPRVIEVQTP